ncbi:MAG: TonB-dependent receptor, partial [bacterium]|nr:TonB-dependent receptor [bacterium]
MRNIPCNLKRHTCLLTWFFLILFGATVQAATIRGFVRDHSSRETIPGASVQIANTNIGTPANLDGFYILSNLSAGNYTLRFSAMGYAVLTKPVTLDANAVKTLDVELAVTGVQQKEIEVIGEREENDEGRQTAKVSSVVIESQRIKNIPALAGEVDILRMIQAIPGVKSTSDISTGLNVRGGNSAMCLIQMDQSAVYNPSHMFGIFSTFNGDAVKHLQLMKGGFSAEYGGRAGSILEVVTKEGNRNETKGNVSLGIVSSRALIEGPLPGKQGSYALSGRRTYFDFILDPLRKNEDFKDLPDYYFYDANGKLNWDFNEKTTLTVAGYTGLDDMTVEAGDDDSRFKISTQWGNRTFASRLRHVVSTDAFVTFGYTYSRYASDFSIYNEGRQMMAFTNQFHDQMLRTDGEYHGISNHTFRTGIEAHRFSVVVKSMNEKTTQADINGHSWNIAHYLQDNWKLAPKLEMKYGLRWYWHEMGKWTKFDPRLAFVYHYNPMTRFKLAGGRYHQWIELINGDASGASFEIWVPNDGSISPMYSDQT